MKRGYFIVLSVVFFLFGNLAKANSGEEKSEAFSPGELITHHITDAHEWHFATVGEHEYALPLPVILYVEGKGLEVFSSGHLYHNVEGYNGYKLEHEHIVAENGAKIYDLSITKNVAQLMLCILILVLIFLTIAGRYKANPNSAPKGIQSFFEPIIMYIRDDIAKPMIGEHYARFLPYLLTVFFFIWFNNLLGLLPGSANVTGNIAVTGTLAAITFLITTFSGNKNYWKHILWTPGVPTIFKLLVVPIEIVGMFTKPFSLMVRLFANITAGHIIILSLLGLIFMFENAGVAAVSIPFSLFMMALELFVALLQAYIFTLLSAMYIGAAVEEHHYDEDHH